MHQHAARIVTRPRRPQRVQALRQLAAQGGPVRDIGEQTGPSVDTTPAPSAVTMIFGRVVVACTRKVPPRPQ
jgi:hypothetical protein